MRRRKKDSGLKTALLLIVAIIFMIMAISVIVIVLERSIQIMKIGYDQGK